MSWKHSLRVRRSIQELQVDYTNGNKKPLEDLMRAWKAVKELPAEDPRSFFMLGGYHGEPFRGAGWGSSTYWGGYCNHGNVLFPTWHRVYLVKLEEALQSIPGCEEVMLPYWDETSADSLQGGIPWALTQKDFVLDGKTIPNPLRSFVFPKVIKDNINGDNPNYSKPQGVRNRPLSTVGPGGHRGGSSRHRETQRPVPRLRQERAVPQREHLDLAELHGHCERQANLRRPRGGQVQGLPGCSQLHASSRTRPRPGSGTTITPATASRRSCLSSPRTTAFIWPWAASTCRMSSMPRRSRGPMATWVRTTPPASIRSSSFTTASSTVLFWLWQKKHGFTDQLEVISEYPGTNSVDSQGPTPGTVPNSWLTLESPLDPFKKVEHGKERPYTSLDCINIEKQLGFTYGQGSLEAESLSKAAALPVDNARVIGVTGINRAPIRGSFLVSVFGNIGGERVLLGTEAVLSRWSVAVLRQLPDPSGSEGLCQPAHLGPARRQGGTARFRLLRRRDPHP